MTKDSTEKAIAYSYRLLSVRPRSEKEIKERLSMKGFDRPTVSRAVSFLRDKKMIDDTRFAKLWVESRMRSNPKGQMLIKKELREKGVSISVIDSTIHQSKEDEGVTIRELAIKKASQLKGLTRAKARKRLFGFLARRGFDFDLINEVMSEVLC